MKKLLTLLFFISGINALSQQDPLFTQYIYNKLAFNPGYAGSADLFSADLLGRFQWTGMEGAPRTYSIAAHTPLRNRHIGLGFYAYSDELGASVDYGAMAAFAYRIIFPSSKLCFGIQAGFKYMDIRWDLLNPKDQNDVLLNNQVTNRAVPDVDFGIYYYGRNYFTGVSVKHLLQNQILISSTAPGDETSFTRLQRNYYAMGGGMVALTGNLAFMPSVLVKYVRNETVQADFTACFLVMKTMTLGASYRTGNALALIVEVNIAKGFSVGYSYDIWFNALKAYNSGSHEIRIGYDLDLFDKDRMLTPRYF